MRERISILVSCAAMVLVGCGGDSGSTGSTAVAESRPEVTAPKSPPPKKLVIEEIEKGTGAPVKAGDEVTVRWLGAYYENGREFGSSWKDHDTFTFLTGSGRVIPGWDRGMVGMRVGGRRELIIPPSLAYEDGETLIYVVDLLAVK